MKVLLAEDSRSMMLTTSAIIKQSGHEVIKAYDGKEALSLYGSEKPDLVLLDVEMPELNGFEVAKKIRSRDEDNWVPIIFLTGFIGDEHLSQGIEAGGDDYLTKPVSTLVLNAKLKAMHRISDMQNKLHSTTKELQKSVITDPLTGAKNRLYLDESIKREWYRSMRNKKEISLLIIDADNFKTLNDTNGHQAGDDFLINIVKLIGSHLNRSTDILCRYGGDEFVVVLPDTSTKHSMKIAETIRKSVDSYNIELDKKLKVPVKISVSIGSVTCIPDDSITYDEYLNFADKALYAAKDAGRNCVVESEISERKMLQPSSF